MKKFLTVIVVVIIMAIIISPNLLSREIVAVKYNNRGDKVYITYRQLNSDDKLFLFDIRSKNEKLLYVGEQWHTAIPERIGDNLIYSAKGNKLYCFNPETKSNQVVFETVGTLLQVEPIRNNRYVIYLEEPEVQECYIGIYDLKTKVNTRLYRMADDGEGDPNRSFGLSISNLRLAKDDQIIFSVCEFDDTNAGWGFYDETVVYRLNPFTKKLKKITKFRDKDNVWDYNRFTNTIVVKSGKNRLKFIKL